MSAEKDRQSRMATSSVNQPMKKGGAGAANWGNADDPATMYDPVGHQHQSVSTAPVQYVAAPQYTVSQPMQVSIGDAQHFPSLGGATTMAPQPVRWGPGMAAPVSSVVNVQQLEAQNRTGVVYDASHPRNTFARKPYTTPAVASTDVQPQAIDWSQAGTQAIQQTMLHVAANPAVLGHSPSVPVYPSTPLNVLKSMPAPVPIHPQHIQKSYTVAPQGYQARVVMQPRGR